MASAGYVCPTCGRSFSRRPIEHTCQKYELAPLLEGKEPRVLAMYQRLVKVARSAGPAKGLQVQPLKTMIALAAPAILGYAELQKKKLKVTLILPGVRKHPAFHSSYEQSSFKVAHRFVFAAEKEFDAAFEGLVREARELAAGEEEEG